jgi:hypothetical protein
MRAIVRISILLAVALMGPALVPSLASGAQGNAAPTGKIQAQSTGLVTTYTAALSDGENNPLYYRWGSNAGCGKFMPSDSEPSTATWDRGAGTPCAPTDTGMVWVHVTDILNYVGCSYSGSATGDGGDCVTATEVLRRLNVRFKNKDGKLVVYGAVKLAEANDAAGLKACTSKAPLDVQKKKSGHWVTKKAGDTNDAGAYSVAIADKKGTYRTLAAQVSAAEPSADSVAFFNCSPSSSPEVPHKA